MILIIGNNNEVHGYGNPWESPGAFISQLTYEVVKEVNGVVRQVTTANAVRWLARLNLPELTGERVY
jgi:hypothetical protein